MTLDTIWTLNYGDEGGLIQQEEKIKVSLKNGEILIGEYSSSDWTSLTLTRNNDDVDIEFEDIEDIDKLS